MAMMLGRAAVSSGESNGQNSSFDNSKQLILTEAVKKDWFLYRVSPESTIRPYPVFDSAGNPSPVCTSDQSDTHTLLSDAFAVLRCVNYAGMDGKLSFVDYCPDIEQWAPVDAARLDRTLYSFYVA